MIESAVNQVLVWFYVLAPVAVLAGALFTASFVAQLINRSNTPAAKNGPAKGGGKPAAGGHH